MNSLLNLNTKTGVKRKQTRDWICYHDPEVMSYSAEEADPRSVQTAKRLRPDGLLGDRIWLLAKNRSGDKFFVHGYFHVSGCVHGKLRAGKKNPLLIIKGAVGLQFRRKVRVDGAAWFQRYKSDMQGLSHGLQRVKDPVICKALMALLADHRVSHV